MTAHAKPSAEVMRLPWSRHFVGPLTPAQQERRNRRRRYFNEIRDIADARYVSIRDAFRVHRYEYTHRFASKPS